MHKCTQARTHKYTHTFGRIQTLAHTYTQTCAPTRIHTSLITHCLSMLSHIWKCFVTVALTIATKTTMTTVATTATTALQRRLRAVTTRATTAHDGDDNKIGILLYRAQHPSSARQPVDVLTT